MNVIQINAQDNVAVAIQPLEKGGSIEVSGKTIVLNNAIPAGHKVAIAGILAGDDVIKYGCTIGMATENISVGDHVHSHNVKTKLAGELTYTYTPHPTPCAPQKPDCFMGFPREDGSAGIRNEIWIVPTVGCVNSVGEMIAKKAQALLHGSVGGVFCLSHPYGCSQLGQDHENTKKALCGLIHHPNAGGVLVLGLGCENNTAQEMQDMLGHGDTARVKFLICQEAEDEIEEALTLIRGLIDQASGIMRQEIPMSKLVVGLKCGGSDGLSGITANPLVGAFSDRLVTKGGTVILTEVPEMFGAETILMNRCETEEIFEKTVHLINDFKAYYLRYNQPVYENPSPGNKAGGITTLEDKSLGCTQKAGSVPVTDVLNYGDPVCKNGLNLLEAPGNDLVAVTALAVSGAHLVLFTTGRGNPLGAWVPTIKISSNSALAAKKRSWTDFDAGVLLSGGKMDEMADALYDMVKAVASGQQQTVSEASGFRDLAIFKNGVTL